MLKGKCDTDEVFPLQDEKYITIISNRRKLVIGVSTILYVLKAQKNTELHV